MSSSGNDMMPLPNAFGVTEDHYWDEEGGTPAKPLVELEMTRLSAALRLKPSWYTKFRDQGILAKWRAEALEQAEHMKESHVDYVFQELDGYAKLRDEETGAEVACYDRIWQSDKLVPAALKAKIVEGVAKLEDVPDSEKDWHPHSNDVVLDLVHPSLYPIVYGRTLAYPEGTTDRDGTKLEVISPPSDHQSSRTRVRKQLVEDVMEEDDDGNDSDNGNDDDGNNDNNDNNSSGGDDDNDSMELEVITPPVPGEDLGSPDSGPSSPFLDTPEDYYLSKRFQWLPTDFIVSKDGKSVKSVSYINNLHPDYHAELHTAIEELIGAYIPLFERVLTDSIPSNRAVPARTDNSYSYDEDYKPEPDWKDDMNDGEEEDYNTRHEEWSMNRPINLPDVPSEGYAKGSLEKRSTWYSLAGKTIQVIVKLANIHLTPEKPEYAGGSWHVEGMSNEAIVASGIYYYSEENITESRLAFRTAASVPGTYEQNDERGCRLTWGISRDDPCVNELGAVVTCQDRAIAFPNIYQHKVSPFKLKDKSKPGHRKIVALFLVDPAIHRPSTTRVPPQQQEWKSAALLSNKTLGATLAPEIIDRVNSLVEGAMTLKEAKDYRLELMNERKAFFAHNDEKFFEVAFSLCEH
ncbi:hypothetical protein FRC12_021032 [Ceratobasidium sp. 428]|nr:hypothetical protein FRC12_021032 [Ceratobasidium sp. 428]